MQRLTAARLHAAVAAVCPVHGIAVPPGGGSAGVVIHFAPEATAPQRTAARAAVDAFDWSEAAHAAWLDAQSPERTALRQAVAQALADNDAYLAIASPSNAQNAAQVRRLTQQQQRLIRRLVQLD